MEANEPAVARQLWGTNRGCWREFVWEPDEVDLRPIRIPEYALHARAARLAAIADDPSPADLLASQGERLLDRHPLMPPQERQPSVDRLMMCDCFHQGLASLPHKSLGCQQHNFRMSNDLSDIPTTFMESVNKCDKLHLRSICVQDPGLSHHGAASPGLCPLGCVRSPSGAFLELRNLRDRVARSLSSAT